MITKCECALNHKNEPQTHDCNTPTASAFHIITNGIVRFLCWECSIAYQKKQLFILPVDMMGIPATFLASRGEYMR